MFEEKSTFFLYALSPIHMGADTSLGIIDNPIQRERHTGHPMIAGSGLKGALRHHASSARFDDFSIESIFGPETSAAEHAGAASFSDAQVVLFPVRSLRETFVYVTCPTALERLRRMLFFSGMEEFEEDWDIPFVSDEHAVVLNDDILVDSHLVLETYRFKKAKGNGSENLLKINEWLGENAIPAKSGMDYFKEKVKDHTVLLPDDKFNYFVKNSTIVEPHVRIEDSTGTAKDGGLFYVESCPPETILASMAMLSRDRRKNNGEGSTAKDLLRQLRSAFDGKFIQVGGLASTGRGQVLLSFAKGSKREGERQ